MVFWSCVELKKGKFLVSRERVMLEIESEGYMKFSHIFKPLDSLWTHSVLPFFFS